MTGKNLDEGFLRQLPSKGAFGQQERRYPLTHNQEVVIGREPNCQIILDSTAYAMVSRRHAVVRPLSTNSSSPKWEICDLGSGNGTYMNGQRLLGCRELQPGDRLTLGNDGPDFIFESTKNYQATQFSPPATPGSNAARSNTVPPPQPQNDAVSWTQLFPIISTRRDLTSKGFLVPGILTVIFVVSMFATVGRPFLFDLLLAAYLATAAYYFVYCLCGKQKPWWVIFASALTTIVILITPLSEPFFIVFRVILPGKVFALPQDASFPVVLITFFFGAGLLEELLKATPVLGAYLLGSRLRSPWRERIGVLEPLDGILLGAASAVGFTLLETLGQYVPSQIESVSMQAGNAGLGQLAGLELLIPRILSEVSGHLAYSGYFGYFIGLSVLKPRQRWSILTIGYLTSAALHALWDSTASFGVLILTLVGVLSYAFLVAAILKARTLSPTRSQNFATRFLGPP